MPIIARQCDKWASLYFELDIVQEVILQENIVFVAPFFDECLNKLDKP